MRFVETPSDVTYLIEQLNSGRCFLHLFEQYDRHPVENKPLVVILKHIDTSEIFVISFSHPDCISINYNILDLISSTDCIKYVIDRKKLLHYIDMKNCIDVAWLHYRDTMQKIETPKYRQFDMKSIPIMNFLKDFKKIFRSIFCENNKLHEIDRNDSLYECELSSSLHKIEIEGLTTTNLRKKLSDIYLTDNKVYTQYNLYTPTSRPSNRFGGINFAALNKKNGDRDFYVSKYGNNGVLVMMDYESYHLRLYGNYVNFDLPTESLHTYLGRHYYDKDNLTEEEYETSKKITFSLIYGGITEDVIKNIPFMESIANYVNKTWKEFNKYQYVKTWMYNRKIKKNAFGDEVNSYKVFNYLLQIAETERNCKILTSIHKYLATKKTKCILYTYDAFLFDVHRDELSIVPELKNVLNPCNKFPIRVYGGTHYGDMKEINV